MADLQKDLLGLKYSPNFEVAGMQEADIDLVLDTVVNTTTTVYGTVTDVNGPIPNATVKVFDKNGLPFKHTLTDEKGEYTVDGLPADTYSVGVVKDGYRMTDRKGVTLTDSDTIELNFVMQVDASLSLGVIAGILTVGTHDNDGKKVPLSGAKISLIDSANTTVAVTYSVDDGEFAFYDIAAGKYTVISTMDGYLSSAPMSITVQKNSIINIAMSMDMDSRTHSGTASGVIKDKRGNAVAGAFVGLYQITLDEHGNNVETLVSATKTNAAGQYLIGNVGEGKYVVKAKMNQ